MAIKKRLTRPPIKARRKPKLPPTLAEIATAVERMGEILAAGHGTQAEANIYFTYTATAEIDQMQSIATTAMETQSWDHLIGRYSQAMTLYVFAGKLYEHYPERMIMTDGAFDKLARWLLKHWDNLNDEFKLWHHITAMGLEAGTALGTQGDTMIRFMISIHTKTPLEQVANDKQPQDTARPLRGKLKRGRKPATGKSRKPTRKRIR